MIKRIQSIEVWTDSATRGEYLLVLRAREDKTLELVNPHTKNQVVRMFASYEEAVHWLGEEEYERVEGRWFADDDDELP
jgi:hypothetical protein